MGLKSMTGFGRADGALPSARWHVEVRSVNGKGFDLRLRLPAGFEALEPQARAIAARHQTRGNVNLTLSVTSLQRAETLSLNEAVLADVAKALEKAHGLIEAAPARLDGILALRGVLEVRDEEASPEAQAAEAAAIGASIEAAFAELDSARVAEGARLAEALAGHVNEVERLTREVAASPARRPEAIAARLAEQVRKLLDAAPALDPARLYQEAVLLATKADVAEEIDRLGAHVAAARDLMGAGGPVGRRLDFLTQEFNREANTLCSKAPDLATTQAGLALKTVIDQMREQVQNIE